MWAMFVRIKDLEGKWRPWRFEGFQDHDEIVNEIEEKVVEENGPDSFRSVCLPD